jgi:hypothetical protein
MSTPAEIITQLETQLANNATLSYVKKVMLGYRENITAFPSIVIEPGEDNETEERYGKQTISFDVTVVGCISVTDKDKQIVGDSGTKGILDFQNDIKKAIDSDRTLGGKCLHVRTPNTKYKVNFPYREVAITVRILFEQNTNVRT